MVLYFFAKVGTNIHHDELICDFQPSYVMTTSPYETSMGRSLVFIIQQRGGRFFHQDDPNGRFHELNGEIEKTMQTLVKGLNATKINTEANILLALHEPPSTQKKESKSFKDKGQYYTKKGSKRGTLCWPGATFV